MTNRAVRADKEGKKKEKMGGEEKEETERRGKKNETWVFRLSLRSTEIGPSVCEGVRSKVHIRGESFAWVQESRNFVKLQEVGAFPT